jgi:hypothetical protein
MSVREFVALYADEFGGRRSKKVRHAEQHAAADRGHPYGFPRQSSQQAAFPTLPVADFRLGCFRSIQLALIGLLTLVAIGYGKPKRLLRLAITPRR